MLVNLLLVAVAYLVGSVASAIIVCRLMRLPDPRRGGSGNPGATNVLRLGGRWAAALTLAGDVLKGLAPVLLALYSSGTQVAAAAALAAFLGHLYPVYFGFKGGKGVATAVGAVAGLSLSVTLAVVITWVAVVAATRFVSLASMLAAVSSPLFAWLLAADAAVVAALAVMAAFIVVRHRANIQRLRAGTESRLGENAKA